MLILINLLGSFTHTFECISADKFEFYFINFYYRSSDVFTNMKSLPVGEFNIILSSGFSVDFGAILMRHYKLEFTSQSQNCVT